MNLSPLVSVVVPCLNRADFLISTLDSILSQDYAQVECIVVDGGSTDGTLDILHSYGDHIRWVSEPDGGHADAINKGWQMSRGEILAWLNADDLYVTPAAISQAVYHFNQNPHADVIFGDCARMSETGDVISNVLTPRPWDLTYAVKYCYFTIAQPTAFIKRDILEKVGWLDPNLRNLDMDLWLRIGLRGKIQYVPAFLAYLRDIPGLSQHPDRGKSSVQIIRKFFTQPNLSPPFTDPAFQRRALSNAYLIASTYDLYSWRALVRYNQRNFYGQHPYLKFSLTYLGQALKTDPSNLFHITTRTLINLIFVSLPAQLQLKVLNSKFRLVNLDYILSRLFKKSITRIPPD